MSVSVTVRPWLDRTRPLATSSSRDAVTPSGASRPLRRDAERNRERIVLAAREVFASQGLSAGFNEIAHHAGVGVGTVYRRFPDKDALIEAALKERVQAMGQAAHDALGHEHAWDGMVYLFGALTTAGAANRGVRDLIFSSGREGRGHQLVQEEMGPLLRELTDRAHAEGSLRPDATVADVILAHFMIGELAHHSAGIRPTAYRRLLTLLLDGFRARPDGSSGTPFDEKALETSEVNAIIDSWLTAGAS
jgi:AcrR family transcriptional regulator